MIDDQPPVDLKVEKQKTELLKLLPEATRRVKFRVFKLKKGWESRPYAELRWMRNWLVTVIGLCKMVDEIESRHSPEVWARYRAFEIKGLAEQKELNIRLQNLQIFLNKNKPPYLVKAKPDPKVKVTWTQSNQKPDQKT